MRAKSGTGSGTHASAAPGARSRSSIVKVIVASVRVVTSEWMTSVQLARSVPDTTPVGAGRGAIRAAATAGAATVSAANAARGKLRRKWPTVTAAPRGPPTALDGRES